MKCKEHVREDLANDDPGTRAPGGSEEEDVDADESNHGALSVGVTVHAVGSSSAGDSDDEFADAHANGTPDEQRATTELLNGPEGDRGGTDVDDGGDHGDQESVLKADELEEDSGVIKDEVDTSPLLEHLESNTDEDLASVGVALADTALEAANPRDLADLHLVLIIGLDLSELVLDVVGVNGLATDTGKGLGSGVEALLLDKVAGRFREKEETDGEDDGPEELDSDGNAVRARVVAAVDCVGDNGSQHETDGYGELVAGDDGTTDLLRSDLRHVENVDGRDETDTDTSDQTTNDKERNGGRSDLENDTNGEDTAASNDGKTTTEPVGKSTGDKSTEEGTGREDRDDEGGVRGGDVIAGRIGLGDLNWVTKVPLDISSTEDTVDVSRVETEEDTSKGSESAHEVGLEGDRRLNALHSHGRHGEGSSE